MSDEEIQDGIIEAIDALRDAGVDARLSVIWNGGHYHFMISLVNVERLPDVSMKDILNANEFGVPKRTAGVS